MNIEELCSWHHKLQGDMLPIFSKKNVEVFTHLSVKKWLASSSSHVISLKWLLALFRSLQLYGLLCFDPNQFLKKYYVDY
jgi:hypothetical protein